MEEIAAGDKMRLALQLLSLILIFALMIMVRPSFAETDIMFVLDTSGSMAQKIGAETKMSIAKRAFGNLVDNLSENTNTGLVVYGHHGDRDCDAIETMVSLGPNNASKMKQAVAGLSPLKGATPLTNALYIGAKSLVEDAKGERTVVLISDGKENCDDDPVAFITRFVDSMPSDKAVKFYVVGLDVDAESKLQLEQIAKIGGGAYYGAGNEEELTQALSRVAGKIVKTPIFEDDFSAPFLNDAWIISNDIPDARLLDEGQLSIITKYGKFEDESLPNLISYGSPIAEDNYDLSVKVTVEAPGSDYSRSWSWGHISFGLRMAKSPTDDVRFGVALVGLGSPGAYGFLIKTGGKRYEVRMADATDDPVTIYLRLEKRKFKYSGFVSSNNEDWKKLGTILLIGKNLTPQLYATTGDGFHEALVSFDDFKILRVEKK